MDLRIDPIRNDRRFGPWRDKVFRGTTGALGDVAARYAHIDRIQRLAGSHKQTVSP